MSPPPPALRLGAAVLLPLVLFGVAALRTPMHIDGAMNLQVAQRLVDRGEYARQYDYVPPTPDADPDPPWVRFHPSEVQTNGPFVFVAAAAVGLLGTGQLGLQAANLAFLGLFAAAVWWLLDRASRLVAVVAPTVVLLLLPSPFKNAIGGFGEIPALSLVVLAVALLAWAGRAGDDRTALRAVTGSLLAAGLAVVTKTYVVGALPALVLGALALAPLRSLPLRRVLVRLPVALAPVVAFELYRLVNLGSVSAYRRWWDQQTGAIAYQSGLDPSQGGRFADADSSLADSARLLAERAGLPLVLLALLLVATTVGVVLLARSAWRSGRADLGRGLLPAAVLTALALTYVAWWLLLLPERRAFDRRAYPALVALYLAVALVTLLAARWPGLAAAARRGSTVALAVVTVVLLVATDIGTTLADGRIDRSSQVEGYELAAARVAAADPETRFYGIGFWSAPLVSLLADRPFRNLEQVDLCELDRDRDVVVWDPSARAVFGPVPEDVDGRRPVYTPLPGGVVRFYGVEPPGDCQD